MRDSFFEKYKTSEVTNTRRVINTPSAFTREHFFYIQEAGYLKSLKPHMSRRSGLQSYLFLIVLSGSGEVAYRDTAKPVPATGSDMGRRSGTSAAGDGENGSLATVHAKAGDCFFLDCRPADRCRSVIWQKPSRVSRTLRGSRRAAVRWRLRRRRSLSALANHGCP